LTLPYVPVAAAYLAVRVHVLHGFSHAQSNIPATAYLLTLPSVLFFYLRQWLLPIRFSEFYDLPMATGIGVRQVLLPLASILITAGTVWLFRRRLGGKATGFAALWMALLLLPALDFAVFPPGELVHDRYFYLPSFGVALLAGLAAEKLAHGQLVWGLPRGLLMFVLAVMPPLSYGASTASNYWLDDYTLFEHARQVATKNVTARNNYAVELARRGDVFTALPILQDLLREHPDNWLANYNFARLSYQIGQMGGAKEYFERAEKIDPKMPDTYLQLGLIDLRYNRLEGAESNMRKAIALRPEEPNFHFALGVTLLTRGSCSEARTEFSTTLSLKPGFPHAAEQMKKCAS
jgi:Flp pilus assembly protein TadD